MEICHFKFNFVIFPPFAAAAEPFFFGKEGEMKVLSAGY